MFFSFFLILLHSLLFQELDPRDSEVPLNSDLFDEGQAIVERNDEILQEASGIDESFNFPNHYWIHNDSGDRPFLYLINSTGEVVMKAKVKGAQHQDWEDIATARDENGSWIYIGDIGDNRAQRRNITIYRVKEPTLIDSEIEIAAKETTRMDIIYSEGARDAETLMYDPATAELVLVTKRENNCMVYQFPFEQTKGFEKSISAIGELPFRSFTAGDINEKGEILLKNYHSVFYWPPSKARSADRIAGGPESRIPYKIEPQGEAVCWIPSGFLTISEKGQKGSQNIWKYTGKE